MKTFNSILLGLTLSISAHAATNSESIEALIKDTQAGQTIDTDTMAGAYTGTCFVTYKKHIFKTIEEYKFTTEEALYVGKFTNSKGSLVDLAISTEQTHGDLTIPQNLAFLLKADEQGLAFIKEFVKAGVTGVDNNLGKLKTGEGYTFNYVSKKDATSLTVKTERLENCQGANSVCNPPVLQGCAYGLSRGITVYEGCLQENDQTVFKQLSDSTIISHRTADQLGEPSNNFSCTKPEISSYCVFEKK